jgi:hypothetical protein
MPFKPGKSGNPLGKPKGTKGKLSTKVKEALATALEGELENIQELLHQLEPKERIDAISRLLPCCMPRLAAQSISVDAEVTTPKRPIWIRDGDEETNHLYN